MVHSFKINRILLVHNSMSIYETKLKAKKIKYFLLISTVSLFAGEIWPRGRGRIQEFKTVKFSFFARLTKRTVEEQATKKAQNKSALHLIDWSRLADFYTNRALALESVFRLRRLDEPNGSGSPTMAFTSC